MFLGSQHFVTCSQLLEGFKCESQTENNRKARNQGTLLDSQHFRGVEGRVELQDGTRKNWQASTTHTNLHKTNTRWLVHSWSTFGVTMSHEQPWTHKTHHGPDLGEATTFPLIIYFVALHGHHIQMVLSRDSQMRVPKFP